MMILKLNIVYFQWNILLIQEVYKEMQNIVISSLSFQKKIVNSNHGITTNKSINIICPDK